MSTTTASREGLRGGLRERARRIVSRLLAGQLLSALLIAGALAVFVGLDSAHSALVGALIGIVPNYYLAGRMRKLAPGATPAASLRGIYSGEVLKIAFTAALFVIAIRLLDVDFLIVVATYFAMIVVNWVALLVVDLGESPAKRTPG